ncbi:25187_t:CDS:1 [Dentiscutata erythropus]|uniref:25187_t:CDS:1 n=1 Tax=Dentiscutata erythropus TaxID=1348616 RepID=A0A9N9HWE2_9GLOM|nr:25187_t:CDS:1 [Dentiscutata erythropus]
MLYSHIVRNHESFDKDNWKSLIQFDKNWEALGFKKAKEIYSSMNKNKGCQSTKLFTKGFSNESGKKQAKPRPQYKYNHSNSISQWKCHNCGFNPNRVWCVRCYKCNAFRSDLNLKTFDPYKMPSMAISEYDKNLLRTEIIRAKG